ncbi:unnamed protein product [Effrenium voratum]|nr:unnamed protein product [Effrenium voratum]
MHLQLYTHPARKSRVAKCCGAPGLEADSALVRVLRDSGPWPCLSPVFAAGGAACVAETAEGSVGRQFLSRHSAKPKSLAMQTARALRFAETRPRMATTLCPHFVTWLELDPGKQLRHKAWGCGRQRKCAQIWRAKYGARRFRLVSQACELCRARVLQTTASHTCRILRGPLAPAQL